MGLFKHIYRFEKKNFHDYSISGNEFNTFHEFLQRTKSNANNFKNYLDNKEYLGIIGDDYRKTIKDINDILTLIDNTISKQIHPGEFFSEDFVEDNYNPTLFRKLCYPFGVIKYDSVNNTKLFQLFTPINLENHNISILYNVASDIKEDPNNVVVFVNSKEDLLFKHMFVYPKQISKNHYFNAKQHFEKHKNGLVIFSNLTL